MKKQKHDKVYFFTTRDLCLVAIFTALIAVCSWISFPLTVPVTLQLFAIFLTLEVLGPKRGVLSVATYVTMGLVGLPVFSGFNGGLGALFCPTGGFIIGFILIALIYLCLVLTLGNSPFVRISALIFGLIACYISGILWFYYYTDKNTLDFILTSIIPLLLTDIPKLILAVLLAKRLSKVFVSNPL